MNIEIANRLVEMRKEKGLSQEALAEQLGISRQAVSKWERAESSPDTSNLIMLAKLYNISLDELLNTDQEKFESGEPIEKEDFSNSTTTRQDEDTRPDYVSIGLNGIHVKDGSDEVHVGWRGIHIKENGEETVRIGQGYDMGSEKDGCESDWRVWVDGENYSYGWKSNWIYSLVICCIYLWIGFESSLWHPGWLLFLTIPVVSSFVNAIKMKHAGLFAYPVLIALGYLYFGFVEHIWHPTWVAFFTIPIYYSITAKIKNRKKENTGC